MREKTLIRVYPDRTSEFLSSNKVRSRPWSELVWDGRLGYLSQLYRFFFFLFLYSFKALLMSY